MTPHAAVESHRNPRVRAAIALRDRRDRESAGATLVDGTRELSRALDGGAVVLEAFVDETRLGDEGRTLLARLVRGGATIVPAAPAILAKLAYGERSEGIVAVVRVPDTSLAGLRLPADPLVVVVEGVEKPGNLGAILRSADAAGADGVIAADPVTDLFNPNAVRASLGTIFSVPVAAAPADAVRTWLAARDIRVVAAWVDGAALHTDTDLTGPIALVLGSEADGLTGTWATPGIERVRLPMLGIADSLNVSVAAAVLLYEARRQRGLPDTANRSRA